jgi:uncharacterized RDD family membrane protein YckC
MRCPKCHYISFGSVDRCRNCGYEFSLATEAPPVDLPIQAADEPLGPMRDLQLGDGLHAAPQEDESSARRRPANGSRLDLPLFSDRGAVDDAPLISSPSAPRQPLSVRRAQPVPPRPKIDRPQDGPESPGRRARRDAAADGRARESETTGQLEVASAGARLIGGIIDVLLLAAIDGAVLYFTLRVLELPFSEVQSLPPVPMAVFLLLLNGGYLATFTAAGGQTIGKMIAGIKVIAQRPEDDEGFDRFTRRVTLGAAVLRATAYFVSLLPAGLGFVAILFDAEGRALHDRLADTRVVKA